jgi:hypothetical protein
MKFFRWQTALNPESKTSTRDRRREPRVQRTRFRPWADLLEDRVVLTTFAVPYALGSDTVEMSLSNAIIAANTTAGNNTIILDYNPHAAYITPGTMTINPSGGGTPGDTLTITNNGSPVTIDGQKLGQIFVIGPSSGAVSINGGTHGITLEGGYADPGNGGAIDYESTFANASLNVTNLTFTDNAATNGGAIYAGANTGPVTVDSSTFGSSTIPGNAAAATGNGGAIDYEGSSSLKITGTITNTTFVDNTADNGGAVEVGSQCDAASFANCQFGTSVGSFFTVPGNSLQEQGNTAKGNGGAIDYEGQLLNKSSLSLTDVTFRQDTAQDGGAVCAGPGTGPVTVTGSWFGDTYPGIYEHLPVFTDGNSASLGGAIYDVNASELSIDSTSFLVNLASGGDGGAIYHSGQGEFGIDGNSVFDSNGAYNSVSGGSAFGGAIYNDNPAGEYLAGLGNGIDRTSFTGNWAEGGGGALGGQGGAAGGGAIADLWDVFGLNITNSTFTGNYAEGGQGGIGSGPGNGGAGGSATGGAIDLPSTHSFDVGSSNTPVTFNNNLAVGGAGGRVVRRGGGSGGPGGNAYGGAVELDSGTSDSIVATFTSNSALAGHGGSGGPAGNGGGGGTGEGGALLNQSRTNTIVYTTTIDYSTFTMNKATGGGGGTGNTRGPAGRAYGGALANVGTLYLGTTAANTDSFGSNTATGGTGSQPNGNANYGSGIGGGVFNSGSLWASYDTFTENTAQGVAGGYGNGGGLANASGNVDATDLWFTNNRALVAGGLGAGGAIETYLGTFILLDSMGARDVGHALNSNPGPNLGIYDDGTGIVLSTDSVD